MKTYTVTLEQFKALQRAVAALSVIVEANYLPPRVKAHAATIVIPAENAFEEIVTSPVNTLPQFQNNPALNKPVTQQHL